MGSIFDIFRGKISEQCLNPTLGTAQRFRPYKFQILTPLFLEFVPLKGTLVLSSFLKNLLLVVSDTPGCFAIQLHNILMVLSQLSKYIEYIRQLSLYCLVDKLRQGCFVPRRRGKKIK